MMIYLRLCLDSKYLNQVIQREQFAIPTNKEISAILLCGKAIFTVLE